MYFGGYEDRGSIGEPLVLPNILTPGERDVVKALAANASGDQKTAFERAIDDLYDLCRNPNALDLDGNGQPDKELLTGLVYGTNVATVTVNGRPRRVTNAVPEVFMGGPKALTAADVAAAVSQGIPTLQNVAIPVTEAVSGPRLGGFSVLTANVLAENGVIHAIDGVLVPPGVLAQLQ
jgi:hypothetical protein